MRLNNLKAVHIKVSDKCTFDLFAGMHILYITKEPVKVTSKFIAVLQPDRTVIWPFQDVKEVESEDIINIDGRYFRRYTLASAYWNESTNDKGEIEHWIYLESIYNTTYMVKRSKDLYGDYVYKVLYKEHAYEIDDIDREF